MVLQSWYTEITLAVRVNRRQEGGMSPHIMGIILAHLNLSGVQPRYEAQRGGLTKVVFSSRIPCIGHYLTGHCMSQPIC